MKGRRLCSAADDHYAHRDVSEAVPVSSDDFHQQATRAILGRPDPVVHSKCGVARHGGDRNQWNWRNNESGCNAANDNHIGYFDSDVDSRQGLPL